MSQMEIDVTVEGFNKGDNINSLFVPPYLKRKVKCGIDWIDDAMGGKGFTPSTCGMLTGTPGAGKTTLMLQFANAITQSGNVCLYNTREESLYQVRMTCERLKLEHGFVAGQEMMTSALLDYAGDVFQQRVKNQRVNGEQKTMFLLIDSLQTMNDGKYSDGGTTSNTPVRVAKALTEFAKKKQDVVVIFIGQVTKSGKFAGKNMIKHMVDMHLHLYIDEEKKSQTWGERIFTSYKNRFGSAGRTFVIGMGEKGIWKKGEFTYDAD